MKSSWIAFSAVMVILVLAAGCASTAPQGAGTLATPTPSGPVPSGVQTVSSSGSFVLHVADLKPGDPLPAVYTCVGTSESPPVTWENVPAGTKSLALVLDDPDAQSFTHWIVFNIPPDVHELARAQPDAKVLSNGAQIGDNTAGSRGYYPPCPPPGAAHRYRFRLYAVDMDITQPTADRDSIDWALIDHTLGRAEFVTTYKR